MATAWCRDSGIFAKMFSDAHVTLPGSSGSMKQVDKPLGIWHLAPSFLLIAAGLLLSVMTFCAEISLKRCKKRTRAGIRTDNIAPRSIHVRVMAQ